MKTPAWIKKLGGHAGELYVAAELSKRGIPNTLLPENFTDDDLMIGRKGGNEAGFVQVKACHPDRSKTFIVDNKADNWETAADNEYVVFVWLGSPGKCESPRYWIAAKREFGIACRRHPAYGTPNWERRFAPEAGTSLPALDAAWLDNWRLFDRFLPCSGEARGNGE